VQHWQEVRLDFAQTQRNPGKHVVGISVMLLVHVFLAWAIMSGLAQRMVDVIKAPIETKIIEEVQPPPPPPPQNLPPPPKFAPPPPSFVPPPEVVVNPPPTPAPTITTTIVAPPPAPVTIAPPPPPVAAPPAPAAPAAPPAPPAPPRPPVEVAPKLDFARACSRPEYNSATRRAETQGAVTVLYTMDTDGVIRDATVEKSSGPSREHKMLDRLTLEAILACKGTPGTIDGKPQKLTSRVTYVWKITD